MADKQNILDALIDLIAEAVVAKIKAEGADIIPVGDTAPADTTAADAKAAAADAKKAEAAKKAAEKKAAEAKAKAKEADEPAIDRDAVFAKVKELSERDGKPAARKLINVYGAEFGKVPDEDLGKLLADVEEALAEEAL